MDPLLLDDVKKVESTMRATLLALEDQAKDMDLAEVRRQLKHVAASLEQIARILIVVVESSEVVPLDFELSPELLAATQGDPHA